MSEHTPAPWKIVHMDAGTYRVAAKQGPIDVCPAIVNGLADARLICAAPDMLAVLKYAERVLSSYSSTKVGVHHAALGAMRAIIASAEGRS